MTQPLPGTFTCPRFTMRYAVFGEGEKPMVILPGMSLKSVLLSIKAVAASYKVFQKDYRIYCFDRTDDMPDAYSVDAMAEDTALAMTGLGIEGACVFGASQGGMMAQAIAARHPSLVSRLAVSSTLARPTVRCRETMERWIALCRKGDSYALSMDVFRTIFSPQYYEKYERAIEVLSAMPVSEEEVRRFEIMSEASMNFDIYGELWNIVCPTLATGVEDDTVLSGQGVRDIVDALGCESRIYPGKGHSVYDEDKAYPEMLKRFFDGGSVTAP